MSQQDSDIRVLRVGVVQAGKVIEERVIRERTTVSVGHAPTNTVQLSADDIPARWPLFEKSGDKYVLVFDDSMAGRVMVGDSTVDFSTLIAQGLAEKAGGRFRVPLDERSRGRVNLGSDITVLFHFVAAPAKVAQPQLPPSAQRGWVKAIEPIFTLCLTASFAVHGLTTLMVYTVEQPPPPDREAVLAAIRRVTPPDATIIPPPSVAKPTDLAALPSKKPAPMDKPAVKPTSKEPVKTAAASPSRTAPDRAAIRDRIRGKGILGMIGANSDAAVGAVFSSVGSVVDSELSTALDGVDSVGMATSGSNVTRRNSETGDGRQKAAGIESLKAQRGNQRIATRKNRTSVGTIKTQALEEVDGDIDRKAAMRVIRRQARAVQSCYENALKTLSTLKGKLVVEITVDERGRVIEARVLEDSLGSESVARCVLAVMRRMRFPKPDGEVTIANTFVFQPQS